jgi:ribosomal protein S18 acetylase RimI-like enzyme
MDHLGHKTARGRREEHDEGPSASSAVASAGSMRGRRFIYDGSVARPVPTNRNETRVSAVGNTDRNEARPASKNGAPKAITVERMTHEGIPDICALYKRVWDHFPDLPVALVKAWEPTPLEFSSWMEGVTYFAARVDGKMVGAIGSRIHDGNCEIVHLAVDPEGRRQSVGSALTFQAIEWARKNHCNSVWAESLARFTVAAEMFKKLGFHECGVLHRHHFDEDVRLFEKLL